MSFNANSFFIAFLVLNLSLRLLQTIFSKMESPFNVNLWSVAISLTFIVLVYLYFKYKANYWRRKGVNGPKPIPIFGNLLDHLFTAHNILEEQRLLKYGRVYGTMQGWKPVITVAEPKLVKKMLVTDFRAFMNHSQYFTSDPMLSKMLGELNGNEWKRMKAILSPTFTASKLKSMHPLIQKCVRNTLKYFDNVSEKQTEFDAKIACLSFTMDVIARCVFGIETNSYEDPYNEFVMKAHELTTFKSWRILCALLLPKKIQKMFDLQLFPVKLTNYFASILNNAIHQRRQMKKQQQNDFVTLLLNAEIKEHSAEIDYNCNVNEEKKRLTENELIAQCFLFFFAGYDTTSTTLQFLLYSLAVNPNVQKRLFDEIHSFTESKDHDFEKLNALPYLDAVINETLRHYTAASIVEHVCTEDYELGDTGITIEKGTVFAIPFAGMQRDPILFQNPHQFLPERFLPENRDNIEPYSFIPFGCGPRMCIGYRFAYFMMKLFLADFVNSFEVVKTKNTVSTPNFTGKYAFLICDPLLISVRRRQ